LRSLFFLLMKAMNKFYYLKTGLSILLIYIGIKLIIAKYLEHMNFKTIYSLYIILVILSVSVFMSILFPPKKV
jgi:tellurite resistance protein TerC